MSLKITKRINSLKTAKARYSFISRTEGTITTKELAQIMASEGSTLTSVDTIGVMEQLEQTVASLLKRGYRVKLPFVDLYMGASGSAQSEDTHFTPYNNSKCDHEIKLRASINQEMVKHLGQVSFEKGKAIINARYPHIKDISVAGSYLVITGFSLDFDSENNKEGVLIKDSSKTYRASEYSEISKNKIIVKIPQGITGQNITVFVQNTTKNGGIRQGKGKEITL